jgi:hypothetical protein
VAARGKIGWRGRFGEGEVAVNTAGGEEANDVLTLRGRFETASDPFVTGLTAGSTAGGRGLGRSLGGFGRVGGGGTRGILGVLVEPRFQLGLTRLELGDERLELGDLSSEVGQWGELSLKRCHLGLKGGAPRALEVRHAHILVVRSGWVGFLPT